MHATTESGFISVDLPAAHVEYTVVGNKHTAA
jgi:hypothetical protein